MKGIIALSTLALWFAIGIFTMSLFNDSVEFKVTISYVFYAMVVIVTIINTAAFIRAKE